MRSSQIYFGGHNDKARLPVFEFEQRQVMNFNGFQSLVDRIEDELDAVLGQVDHEVNRQRLLEKESPKLVTTAKEMQEEILGHIISHQRENRHLKPIQTAFYYDYNDTKSCADTDVLY